MLLSVLAYLKVICCERVQHLTRPQSH